ncbi:MAG: hypothetical protein ACRECX_12610 [Methyloceanibacter sp.]|uniref:hypothetical protein n=1 Tax=Methyloceanibacter sp. TaxID=1965321 RepID=UPI003D6D1FCE
MRNQTGPTLGLLVSAASVLAFAPSVAAVEGEEAKTESIGPWEIEATYKADNFDRCTISRKLDDDVVVTFVRKGEGLTLLLTSPNWKLESGKQYPVTMKLGPRNFDMEVAAEASSVSTEIGDDKFASGLRAASALDVVAAGATIRVPLDKSGAALDRLEECVAKNERAVETNPFVAPARRP